MNDLRVHGESGFECWCRPRVETIDPFTGQCYPDGVAVVIHNSADGRELVERHGLQ